MALAPDVIFLARQTSAEEHPGFAGNPAVVFGV